MATKALATQNPVIPRKVQSQADADIIAQFQAGGLIPLDKLVESGTVPPKPKALTPEDLAATNAHWIWDLNTLSIEAFNHPQGGQMEGLRVEVINPEDGSRHLFMSASAGLVQQIQAQIFPTLEDLPSMFLPVKLTGTPHKTDPSRSVWKME